MDLKDRKIAVIGSTGGLGKEIVNKLKNQKANVVEIDRNNSDMPLDLLCDKSIDEGCKKLIELKIDGVIFASGVNYLGLMEDTNSVENIVKI